MSVSASTSTLSTPSASAIVYQSAVALTCVTVVRFDAARSILTRHNKTSPATSQGAHAFCTFDEPAKTSTVSPASRWRRREWRCAQGGFSHLSQSRGGWERDEPASAAVLIGSVSTSDAFRARCRSLCQPFFAPGAPRSRCPLGRFYLRQGLLQGDWDTPQPTRFTIHTKPRAPCQVD